MSEKQKTTKLLHCPFCGGRPFIGQKDTGGFYVRCAGKDCQVMPTTFLYSLDHAIEAWNKRV